MGWDNNMCDKREVQEINQIVKSILIGIVIIVGFVLVYSIPNLLAIESRIIYTETGQKIEFAKGKVNGIVCWTQEELDETVTTFNQFSGTSPVIIDEYTIDNFEKTISTSGLTFSNYSDFKATLD